MKELKVFSIMLACLMALVLVSCEDSVNVGGGGNGGGGSGGGSTDPALNGTWIANFDGSVYEYLFNNGNYEGTFDGHPVIRAVYTTNAGIMTMTATQFYDYDSIYGSFPRWYTRNELALLGVSSSALNEFFITWLVPYHFANNNTLILNQDGLDIICTRK